MHGKYIYIHFIENGFHQTFMKATSKPNGTLLTKIETYPWIFSEM